jgi:hypothetical protein
MAASNPIDFATLGIVLTFVKDAVLLRGPHGIGKSAVPAAVAKKTGMLDNLFHFPAPTYRQLMALEADLQSEGPLHSYLRSSFGLSDRQFEQLVSNTLLAAATLRSQCQAGSILFDLDPGAFLLTGNATPEPVDCAAP